MKPLRHTLLWVLLTGLLLGACQKEDPQWPPRPKPETADQTLLVYLGGQTLLRAFKGNIAEIRQAIDQHILYDSRLLLYVEPSIRESYLIEYSFDYATQSSRGDTLRRYERPALTSDHVGRVMQDAFTEAPAHRYGMILGSHGAGWVPATYPYLTQDEGDNGMEIWSNRPIPYEATDRHPLLYKSDRAREATRWFGEFNGGVADLSLWIEAIQSLDTPLEYLIFDACFMSNIEALYALRHSARYIVASPCEIMGRGMPYASILGELFTEKGTSYDLKAYCAGYYDFYLHTTETKPSGCIALTRCEELDNLAAATRRALQHRNEEVDPETIQPYDGLDRTLFYDLGQYIEQVCGDSEAYSAFVEQFDRTFPEEYRLHTPSFYSGYDGEMTPIHHYSGVSTSAPSTKYPTAYAQTAWYEAVN